MFRSGVRVTESVVAFVAQDGSGSVEHADLSGESAHVFALVARLAVLDLTDAVENRLLRDLEKERNEPPKTQSKKANEPEQ